MRQSIATIALLVRDYDEAIAFYTGPLGFRLVEDTDLGDGKRWVLVAPPGSHGTRLLLARADGPEQAARIGDQTGGRVFLFLSSDDLGATTRRFPSEGYASWSRRGRRPTAWWRCSRTCTAIAGT